MNTVASINHVTNQMNGITVTHSDDMGTIYILIQPILFIKQSFPSSMFCHVLPSF